MPKQAGLVLSIAGVGVPPVEVRPADGNERITAWANQSEKPSIQASAGVSMTVPNASVERHPLCTEAIHGSDEICASKKWPYSWRMSASFEV